MAPMGDWRNLAVVQTFQSCQLKHSFCPADLRFVGACRMRIPQTKQQRMAPFAEASPTNGFVAIPDLQ
jgi:hypothetical protein